MCVYVYFSRHNLETGGFNLVLTSSVINICCPLFRKIWTPLCLCAVCFISIFISFSRVLFSPNLITLKDYQNLLISFCVLVSYFYGVISVVRFRLFFFTKLKLGLRIIETLLRLVSSSNSSNCCVKTRRLHSAHWSVIFTACNLIG